MSDEHRKTLQRQLWNVADTLRGKMGADEFRDYMLGFIFYKYLSEKMALYADDLLKGDKIKYAEVKEHTKAAKDILKAVKVEALEKLGYFLKPSELFHKLAEKGNSKIEGEDDEAESAFILDDLQNILNHIEQSTLGTDSEEEFGGLFEDLDLTSSKLGKTEKQKNELIAKVLAHLNKIDFRLKDTDADILGDAYEYLIGKFASGAGKKAGEFYTPQAVSTILAKIVTTGKKKLKSVYDPTCGSGSLLLRVAREVKQHNIGMFYGQEMNRTTFNLARMNMILHDVHYSRFDLQQEDTLAHPQHESDMRFEAVVANPPFSAKWSASNKFLSDDRFRPYGKLPPSSVADFAFVQHMLHHLDDNGIMAVVLPHGVLFRGGAEASIRKYLVEQKNYIDAVIGLPSNIFFGTEISTCILVFKKSRGANGENIIFIDASQSLETETGEQAFTKKNIDDIIEIYRSRRIKDGYSYLAALDEVKNNKFNLNIPHYVRTQDIDAKVNTNVVAKNLHSFIDESEKVDKKLDALCKELGITSPFKKNIIPNILNQKLRFKDERGKHFPKWISMPLSEYLFEAKSRNYEMTFGKNEVLSVSREFGIVNQIQHLGRSYAGKSVANYHIVQTGDIVYTKSPLKGNPYGIIKYNDGPAGIVSTLYAVYRCKPSVNGKYLDYYFQLKANTNNYLKSLVNKGAKNDMKINNGVVLTNYITIPSKQEQDKIVEFFVCLDKKIQLVKGQLNQLLELKTGLLQEMSAE
jgi:type I restriction enzyme M protein